MVKREFSFAVVLILLASGIGARGRALGDGEKLGVVHFDTSCNETAQKEFNHAVALLHSFQFSRAIVGFNSVLADDQTCAIAYWGIALSDWSNPFAANLKDRAQLENGQQSAEHGKATGAKTAREQAYIAAVSKLYADFEHTAQRSR